MHKHVLLYHWCRSSQKNHGRHLLQKFFQTKEIIFASVDTTGDRRALIESGFSLPLYHLDIQLEFGVHRNIIGMATLAGEIIDSSYHEMKENFPSWLHSCWDRKPLCRKTVDYAAVDGYLSYELYSRVQTMKDIIGPTWLDKLLPLCKKSDETSRSGNKRSERRN